MYTTFRLIQGFLAGDYVDLLSEKICDQSANY